MSFENPAAWGWLVPLGAVIIALYLLKMQRRNVRVPATFLWPAQTDEVRANSLFQRLKPSWLLFLQLLALTLVVAAIARPQTVQRGLSGEVTVLVLDSSASMSATDVRPSRFEEARKMAREAIQSNRPTDRIALIEAGPTPRVIFPLGNDPARQLRALDAMSPTDAEGNVGEALRLASALVGTMSGARIVLLSDGVFDRIEDFSRGKAAFTYRSIGKYGDNLAVTALGVSDSTEGPQVFVGVRNTGATAMEGAVTLYADGKVLDSFRTGPIAPHQPWGKTLPSTSDVHVYEAKLDAPDILKSDNYAATIATAGASLRVLLVGKGDPFLERALALDPRVTLDRANEVPAEERRLPKDPPGGGKYDVVVFDGVPTVEVRSRGVLSLGGGGMGLPVEVKGTRKAPTFISAENVPVLKGVRFEGLFIDQQTQVKAKPDGEVLAQSSAGPLLVAKQDPQQRSLYLAFAPLDSDFPLQVSFPIFIGNALDYLAGTQTASDLAVRAGVPFSIPSNAPVQLTDPTGAKTELTPTGGSIVIREVKRVGKYDLAVGAKHRAVYGYLRNERESDLLPPKTLALGGGTVKSVESPSRFSDFWRPIVALALLALAGEWWLFARRS